MTPRQVGDLPIVEFLILVDGIEARLKAREASAKNGVWIP